MDEAGYVLLGTVGVGKANVIESLELGWEREREQGLSHCVNVVDWLYQSKLDNA